jgi:hypothetical protein
MLEDPTVDGAMFQSLMKMDMRVPSALMSEMTHGTVVINMIPLPARQDGLAIEHLTSVLWPTQEMDSEVNQPVKTTANHQDHTTKPNIDATLPVTNARNAKMEMKDVKQIEPKPAITARMAQTQLNSSNATRPTQNNQNVICAQRVTQLLVVHQEVQPVNHAHQNKNSLNVTKRH